MVKMPLDKIRRVESLCSEAMEKLNYEVFQPDKIRNIK